MDYRDELEKIIDETQSPDGTFSKDVCKRKFLETVKVDTTDAYIAAFEQTWRNKFRPPTAAKQLKLPFLYGDYFPDELLALHGSKYKLLKRALVQDYRVHVANSRKNRQSVVVADDIKAEAYEAFAAWSMDQVLAGEDAKTLTFQKFYEAHPSRKEDDE